MFDFSHISPAKTAKLTLGAAIRCPGSDSPIVLEVRYAGDGNPGYLNATRTMPADTAGTGERAAKILGRHVVCGWANVTDGSGKAIQFTPDAGEALLMSFLAANRRDVINYVLSFTTDADNFHGPLASASDLGKG